MSSIWTPQGVLPTGAYSVLKAVEEYDADLTLGQDGPDWVVLKKSGPEGRPFPVFNFGHELPSADHVKQRLAQCDVRRNSRRIVDSIIRKQRIAEQEARLRVNEASGESAEVIEWAMRQQGATPHKKVFIGGKRG